TIAPFTAANVDEKYFQSGASNPNGKLSQYDSWSPEQKNAATPASMIAFLRGQNQYEARVDDEHEGTENRLYRARDHVLGDIVDSSPTYVQQLPMRYIDAGYSTFVASQTMRNGMVYVGANDGMLHAFDAQTGKEIWAYVPQMLHPTLYKLADAAYADNHRYYVNGPISIGDVYDGSSWHTILVAGLGLGGKGYFALDVTDPTRPAALWEFTDANMGYSYGNPAITKRQEDGKWVVLFASGYNNVNTGSTADEAAGDGKGHLFVLDAMSGAKLSDLVTDAVTDPNLSGIARVNGWVLDPLLDNSTQYVYGGDLAGNLWRFDINNDEVLKLGQTSTAGAQPITVRPEMGGVRDSTGTLHRVVYFATGRYLGSSDLSGTSVAEKSPQALYAIKDSNKSLNVLKDNTNIVAQTLTMADGVPSITPANSKPVNWVSNDGWQVQLPAGERVNIDPRLQLGTVAFTANSPVDDYCSMGGSTWTYALDFKTGAAVSGSNGRVGFAHDANNIATGMRLLLVDGALVAAVSVAAESLVGGDTGGGEGNSPSNSGGLLFDQTSQLGGTTGQIRRVGYTEIN
ncbi:MAG: hypothetical protein LBE59_03055, partial [Nevskiaceae bacterium]|nr:hypothetical protein [Nevskiaceae bacterium]